MNWSEAIASACTHRGEDFGSLARRRCEPSMSAASTSPPAGVVDFSAVAVKNNGRPAASSAVNVPSFGLLTMQEIPVPGVRRGVLSGAQLQAIERYAVSVLDGTAVVAGGRLKLLSSAPVAVVVAVRDQRLELDADGRAGAQHLEAQIARVGPRRHENSLLQQRVGQGEAPHGNTVRHGEGFQMDEAARIHRAAGEFVGGQMIQLSQVAGAQVDLGDQQHPLDRRLETGHQERVVAACIGTGYGTAGVAAEAVGHQPFATRRVVPVAADIATQRQKRDLFKI